MLSDVWLEAGVAGTEIGDEEGVFVVVACPTEIGFSEDGDPDRSIAHMPPDLVPSPGRPSAKVPPEATARVTLEIPW